MAQNQNEISQQSQSFSMVPTIIIGLKLCAVFSKGTSYGGMQQEKLRNRNRAKRNPPLALVLDLMTGRATIIKLSLGFLVHLWLPSTCCLVVLTRRRKCGTFLAARYTSTDLAQQISLHETRASYKLR